MLFRIDGRRSTIVAREMFLGKGFEMVNETWYSLPSGNKHAWILPCLNQKSYRVFCLRSFVQLRDKIAADVFTEMVFDL